MRSVFKNRLTVYTRVAGGFLLLILLAVCGFAGASRGGVQSVSVPVERQILGEEWEQRSNNMSTAERLARDRREEIEMLDGIIENADTDQATRQSALAQKTQLVGRMELEAQARACLGEMGFLEAQVVCGAQMMTVLLPSSDVAKAGDGARIVSTVADQTGTEPQNVKIILVK